MIYQKIRKRRIKMEITENINNTYSAPFVNTRMSSDVSEEFTLADYYPEVRRVISVTAKAIPEGKFISGNEIDCDGIVAFTVTYLGEDGTVTSVPFTIQFTQSASLPASEGIPSEIVCDSVADNPSCRVTAPRRLALKAHVSTRVLAPQSLEAAVVIVDDQGNPMNGSELFTMEERCTEIPTVRLYYGAASGSVSQDIPDRGCDRAVNADGIVNIIEARAEEGRVLVRAEAVVTLLCQDQNGIYYNINEKAPFEVEVPITESAVGDRAVASAIVTSVEVEMDESGLSFDLEYDMDVQIAKLVRVNICNDIFSTDYESDAETTVAQVYSPIRFVNGHLTQTGELKRHGEAKQGEYVISTNATATPEGISVSNGKLTLDGSINVQSAVAQDGEVVTEDGRIPFSYTTDAAGDASNPVYRADIQIVSASARIEGGVLNITVELAITFSVLDTAAVPMVTKVVLHTGTPREKTPGVKIYFPEPGEEVWNLCKKYGCSRRTLEKLNGWTENIQNIGTAPVIVE